MATGETRYADGKAYSNLFVMRFDGDGRCSEFVEWFMEQPSDLSGLHEGLPFGRSRGGYDRRRRC